MGRALDYQAQTLLQGYIEELRKIYGELLFTKTNMAGRRKPSSHY